MIQTCEPAAADRHYYELCRPKANGLLCVPMSHSISHRLLMKKSNKSFSYHRVPQEPLNLSVIKLDGSTFEVQVPRSATVANLIEAVKEVFDQSLNDDEMISWSHVWGHFCLCYNGMKLLDYKAYIRLIGIKDGDQIMIDDDLNMMNVRTQLVLKDKCRKAYNIDPWRKTITSRLPN